MHDNNQPEAPPPKLSLKLVLYFWRCLRPDLGILIGAFIGLAAQAAFSVLVTLVPTILERNWHADARSYLFFAIGGLLVVNLWFLPYNLWSTG
ncbi:MAG TPA: hypothetical protein VKX17_28180 [Planctomycetota bacterium]|nr:hypothetical protein [Planctomycetota bacterium]